MKCPKCGYESLNKKEMETQGHTYCRSCHVYWTSWQQERIEELEKALSKINRIRNSIVGTQTLNWSEHVYPLVAALDEAGMQGMSYPEAKKYFGSLLERITLLESLLREIAEHEHCNPTPGQTTCNNDGILSSYISEHGWSDWYCGCVEGHRCAAAIARRAFE
jgi:hypothetical protein